MKGDKGMDQEDRYTQLHIAVTSMTEQVRDIKEDQGDLKEDIKTILESLNKLITHQIKIDNLQKRYEEIKASIKVIRNDILDIQDSQKTAKIFISLWWKIPTLFAIFAGIFEFIKPHLLKLV